MYRINFYVPETHLEIVKDALFQAGAGKIGHYDHCCWQTKGTGQFRPLDSSSPHIGKKKIYIQKNKINNTFFESFNSEEFYFLHSYYCKAELSNELAYTTYNDVKFSSAIIKDKIIGVQFHPEKSAKNGINFIKNFLKEEIAIK